MSDVAMMDRLDRADQQLTTLQLERQALQKQADAPPLTAAEKRDAARAAKALKKLQADDAAGTMTVTDTGTGKSVTGEQLDAAADIIKPSASAKQLIAFIERVENVELEIAERSEDRKQIYAEAKATGFDVPTMKKIVALRKMDEHERLEAEALLSTYMHAVGLAVQTEMNFGK